MRLMDMILPCVKIGSGSSNAGRSREDVVGDFEGK